MEAIPGYLNSTLSRSQIAISVLQTLRNDIVLQKFGKNARLTEQFLCDSYEISRSTARQILQQLENEGFVTMLGNGCKAVTEFTGNELTCLYELRNYYELTAVSTIFAKKNKAYSKAVDMMAKLENLSELSHEEIITFDVDFHRTVIEMSDNMFILKGYENIAPVLYTLFKISIRLYEDQFFSEFASRHLLLIRSLLFETEDECVNRFSEHHANAGQRAAIALEEMVWSKKEDEMP